MQSRRLVRLGQLLCLYVADCASAAVCNLLLWCCQYIALKVVIMKSTVQRTCQKQEASYLSDSVFLTTSIRKQARRPAEHQTTPANKQQIQHATLTVIPASAPQHLQSSPPAPRPQPPAAPA